MIQAGLRRLGDAALLASVDAAMRRRHRSVLLHAGRWEPNPDRWRRIGLPLCANDKFAWRKVFDHDPRFTVLSDKLACKGWVRERAPELGQARVLWKGTDPERIPRDILAQTGIAKTSHGWNDHVIFRNGTPDADSVIAQMRRNLEKDHAAAALQWGYFDVPRRVFVEELLGDGAPLQELKIYLFGETIERIIHIADRFGDMGANAYQLAPDGVMRPRTAQVTDAPLDLPLPDCADAACHIARRLGADFDHMRVDLLTDGHQLWLGEMTVYNLSGHITPFGHDPDSLCSRLWDLRRSWFLNTPHPGWQGCYAAALRRSLDRRAEQDPPPFATAPEIDIRPVTT